MRPLFFLFLIFSSTIWLPGCGNGRPKNKSFDLPVSQLTKSMTGKWYDSEGSLVLTIRHSNGRTFFEPAANDSYYTELTSEEVKDDSVCFTQTFYAHDGEFSPFNGEPCKCRISMVNPDQLKFELGTRLTKVESELLTKK